MHIAGTKDTWLDLRVSGYQYQQVTNDLDAQWLMIKGKGSVSGHTWSFTDPSLMIDEAQALTRWLHAAAAGHVQPRQLPARPDQEWAPDLWFTEPVLAFSLGSGPSGLLLRVSTSLEAAPPWAGRDERAPWGYPIDLQLTAADLEQAASDWANDLSTLPPRPETPGHHGARP
jgi:hypothetical protein